jgi:O-antigen/teichoic acid export membrane protein
MSEEPSEQPISENSEADFSVDESWREPGFHRPLAGIMYNIIYILLAAALGVLLAIWLIPNVIYPFPEAMGFENITTQIFVVYFVILDAGIGASIQRFVAADNIKDPKKAIQYIQFFIWYQMFSGVAQMTVIAIYVIYFLPASELAYASWLFLIYSCVQYPGMLGVFRGTLEAFQRFDRANLIGFIQTQLFENVFRIICILIGRWLGVRNPQIGELMGATMGSIAGKYMKDFAAALLAGYWVSPIMKQIDPSFGIKNLFFTQFDRTIVKKCLTFGIKVLIPGLVSPLGSFIAVSFMIRWLPNYSTILGLYLLGEMLSTMVNTFSFPGIASLISQTFQNGKYKLTQNYISRIYRWSAIMSFFMVGLLFSGSILIGIIAGETWYLVTPIIQVFIFFKVIGIFASVSDQLFVGVGKPEYNILLMVFEQITRLFVLWLLLVPFPSSWYALVYSMGLGWTIKWLVGALLFHKKILPIKINIWQTFIAPFLAAMIEAIYVWMGVQFLHPLLSQIVGIVPSAIFLMVLGVFTGPFLIFFPMYALLGGWDDASLKIIQKTVKMSGPSTRIVRFIMNVSITLAKRSRLHNRFPIDETGVQKEILELLEIQNKKK